MDWQGKLNVILEGKNVLTDPEREKLIELSVTRKEAAISKNGALATWTPIESTGRSPKDTLIVRRPESENNIDWMSPNNLPLDPETADMIIGDAMESLKKKDTLFVTNRVVGADSAYAMPVKTVSDFALTALFTDNMFRPVPEDMDSSVFAETPFTLIVLPYEKLNRDKYKGRLREIKKGLTSDMAVIMDFDRRLGVIVGSAYMGSVKKLMFTVMNYYLLFEDILPLHCSANEGKDGHSALLLGLSGTGKTTLSADPKRALLGDDEHGWGERGIANFENGCYAKMININAEKEPDIFDAVMHSDDYRKHGVIVENAMLYPTGEFDYDDERLTPNSRSSYPLEYLKNIKKESVSGHPSTILFLTADAYGVLPPVSRLNRSQAMLWFLMGYTSKLAGTETGVKEPEATFSRFFGQPFMPGLPGKYASMLGEKMDMNNTNVYLINTGWTGGAYGTGHRIDLSLTRKMVDAALDGSLEKADYVENAMFHLSVPTSCPGVPAHMLDPVATWESKDEYLKNALLLSGKFSEHFDKAYGGNELPAEIVSQCPGK